MIKTDQLSDSDLKSYAEVHIQYEFDMLLWSARVLAFLSPVANKGHLDWVVFNGLLNTFAIHARNLTLFLYSGDKENIQPSDVVIENYIDQAILKRCRPQISDLLNMVITKANKQVAHLTTDRIQYEKDGKAWNFIEIALEIKRIFSKIASFIPDEKISENLKKKFSEEKMDSPIIQATVINDPNSFPIGLEIRFISEIIKK